MKSHKLAKKLLDMPDVNVYFVRPGGSGQPGSFDAIEVDIVHYGKTESISPEDGMPMITLKSKIDIANSSVNKPIQ